MKFGELLKAEGLKVLEEGKVIRFLGQYKVSNTYLKLNDNNLVCVYNKHNEFAAPFQMDLCLVDEDVEVLDHEPGWDDEDRTVYNTLQSSGSLPYTYLNIGSAMDMLKQGFKVARREWVEKNVFLFLANGTDLTACLFKENTPTCNHSVCMQHEDKAITIGWTPSQEDLLADDYVLVDFPRESEKDA
jgi:hypothetical protein